MKLGVIMSKTVTLRLKEEVYEVLLEAAKAENRPLSNLIETADMRKLMSNNSPMMPSWPRSLKIRK
jgi:predicted CopG family antitoxin